ncbi:hypothetical protein [Bradyrhizobium neotropicale]|uniref:hypothetical protein n=1 Tax=Bradyrhizobium neotropicale TaxID=1497615 RepID=UPI001AD6992D|nr:hypothetical protein [Bradyrhizobium neotropicale]MBO4228032.1 hypothetical protein [Bradyrhizobium neotropicale]
MPRNWRARFDEPIDFALLAAERRGYRHTPETIRKFVETKRKNQARKKRAAKRAAAERIEAARPKRQATPGARQRLLAAFPDEGWYGIPDMIALSGVKRGSVGPLLLKLTELGLVERTKNPAYQGRGFPDQCQWLYRRIGDMPGRDPGIGGRDLGQHVPGDVGDDSEPSYCA